MSTPICRACSKMMREKRDFPRGNFSSDFCADCVDERGLLRPYEEIRSNMILRRMKNGGLTEEEATELVDNLIKSLPVWRDKKPRWQQVRRA